MVTSPLTGARHGRAQTGASMPTADAPRSGPPPIAHGGQPHAGIVTALVAFVLVGLTGCGRSPELAWSPENAELVFSSNRDGDAEIYLRRGRGAPWINLTNHPATDNWPEWSPDGSKIAFQSDRGGNLDIWVMNADGSDPRPLTTHPAHDYLPSWSPDGSRLTFASWRMEPGDSVATVHTYIMRADGSAQRRLSGASPGVSSGAAWAPDGRHLVVARAVGEDDSQLFLTDTAGATVRQLTRGAGFRGAPSYSPDGSKIAFYASRGDTSNVVVISAQGGEPRIVARGQSWYPRWSPGGRWLVYTSAVEGGDPGDLDVMALALDDPATTFTVAGSAGRDVEGRWRPRP